MSRLKERYNKEVRKTLLDKFSYENVMMIPKVHKITISMGIADLIKDKNAIQDCVNELTLIAGQKVQLTKSKKAVSNFKLRKDQVIGVKVTLRGRRMYDFMDRFFNIICPRIRDFHGFNTKCDGHGNYTLGLDDHQIFPELDLDSVKRALGMNITFVTSASTDDECLELLRQLGLPYKNLPVVVAA